MGTTEIKVIGRNSSYELSVTIDEADLELIGQYKWHRLIGRHTTYVAAADKNRKTVYLHRLIMGLMDAPRSECVDHIDGNGLNNSRTNLRVTDNRGNQANARKHLSAKGSSPYKGVRYNTCNKTKPWVAYITLPAPANPCSDNKRRGKTKYLGSYRTQEEAATAYNIAAMALFGEYAKLNDIGPQPTS